MSSRLIVKNLPSRITEKQLKKAFGDLGELTDLQMKFTKDGVFRKFAFVGYQTEEEAAKAREYLDKTFIGTSRISVEECLPIGDRNKPRAWSKYSKESSAFQKEETRKNAEKEPLAQESSKPFPVDATAEKKIEKKQKKKDKKKKKSKLEGNSAEQDPKLKEFLQIQGLDSGVGSDSEDKNLANEIPESEVNQRLIQEILAEVRTDEKCAIFISGLPAKVKLSSVKEFLAPVRLKFGKIGRSADPPTALAFVTLNRASDVRRALQKNGSFLGGFKVTIRKANLPKPAEAAQNVGEKEEEKVVETTQREIELVTETGRIFAKNLSFFCQESDLKKKFEAYGAVSEVTIPLDLKTKKSKGYGIVTFMFPEHAVKAFTELDGTVFQGRMLHLIGGKEKPGEKKEEGGPEAGGSFKEQKKAKEKALAGKGHNWNTLFLGASAVADVLSSQLETEKRDVLDAEGKTSLGVRMALGETQIVKQTKEFLEKNGVLLDCFGQAKGPRSDTIIIVKNLPAKTTPDELQTEFKKFGELGRIVLPPSGISGLVEFVESSCAKAAFKALAYSRFRTKPLFLEWAPVEVFSGNAVKEESDPSTSTEVKMEVEEEEKEAKPEAETTLFVKNLNFDSTDADVEAKFAEIGPLYSAAVSKKLDLRTRKFLSMGYGFVQYLKRSDAQRALKDLQGVLLDGHALELKLSQREMDSEERAGRKGVEKADQDNCTKILVRNIPFQADKKEIQEIFSTFGELRFVRLPSQVGKGKHRGFAFVDYQSKADAGRAFKALSNSTHLYGRRLVLEWAKEDESLEDVRKRTADHFVTGESRAKKGRTKRQLMETLTSA